MPNHSTLDKASQVIRLAFMKNRRSESFSIGLEKLSGLTSREALAEVIRQAGRTWIVDYDQKRALILLQRRTGF